ncbi:prepilin peptidase, partial [Patescibacteria group bacterium]|nr:prepilin peptidase [Patescibacteria group bacterium]
PLLSFILLKRRCRHCKKKISIRYPLIEFSTALVFVLIFYFLNNCAASNAANQVGPSVGISCLTNVTFKGLTLQGENSIFFTPPYFLLIASVLIAIFVIDFEHQIIPDELVFLLFSLTTTALILFFPDKLYQSLLTGFLAATSLLILHLATRGRGMGLGDVKLALFGGLFLGWPLTYTWVFLSFIIGAFVGIILLLAKKAKMGKPIPFGPFLVASFFITLFWGGKIALLIMPFIH